MYSDSHIHLIDYHPAQLEKVIELMRAKEVGLVLSMGVNLDASEESIKLAETYDEIKAAVGIHPWFATLLDSDMRKRFEKLAGSKSVRAIGEIGLDYALHTGSTPDKPGVIYSNKKPSMPKTPASPEEQREVFTFVVTLAKKYDLPVCVHSLHGTHQDAMKILRANPGVRGIAHGFEGDINMLKDWLDLNFYIAFGVHQVIKEPTPDIEEILRATPMDRIISETDATPKMSPDGPLEVISVVRKMAEILGVSAPELGNITTANLKRLLKLE